MFLFCDLGLLCSILLFCFFFSKHYFPCNSNIFWFNIGSKVFWISVFGFCFCFGLSFVTRCSLVVPVCCFCFESQDSMLL